MRFLTIYSAPERNAPPTQAEMDAMGKFIQWMLAEGKLITTEGCLPTRLGARVHQEQGKTTITDGPFSEAKEVVGGFAIIEAKDLDEAKELTKKFLAVAGDGTSEIRQLYEAPAVAPQR